MGPHPSLDKRFVLIKIDEKMNDRGYKLMPEPFKTFTSTAVPLPMDNIDTDQVIPARFLTGTSKAGLGEALFYDLRYDRNDEQIFDFPLNQTVYSDAQILVARHNFGCGSSREHAPWALRDYGFQAVLAVSFADIFKNNALKNGVLPIALPEAVIETLLTKLPTHSKRTITIDLQAQQVSFDEAFGLEPQFFEMDAFRKACILQGLDDIGYSLKRQDDITAFEKHHDEIFPSASQLAL